MNNFNRPKILVISSGLDGSSQHPVSKQKGGFEDKKVVNQKPLNDTVVEIESTPDAPEPPKEDEDEEGPPILPPGVGTSEPLVNKKTKKEKRDPGACLFSSFVPLQLIAHTEEGRSCGKPQIIWDNEKCNSYLSGDFLNFEQFTGSNNQTSKFMHGVLDQGGL